MFFTRKQEIGALKKGEKANVLERPGLCLLGNGSET